MITLCSCSYPHRSGYGGPVNIKQDNCYSLFCNFLSLHKRKLGFPGGLVVKTLPTNAGEPDLIPGSGRSTGEGNGNPLQYLLPGKSHGQTAWWAMYGLWGHKRVTVTKQQTKTVTYLKVKPGRQSLENKTIMYISGYRQHSFGQSCRTSMTEHQQKVRAKGTDPIRCQVCSLCYKSPAILE